MHIARDLPAGLHLYQEIQGKALHYVSLFFMHLCATNVNYFFSQCICYTILSTSAKSFLILVKTSFLQCFEVVGIFAILVYSGVVKGTGTINIILDLYLSKNQKYNS